MNVVFDIALDDRLMAECAKVVKETPKSQEQGLRQWSRSWSRENDYLSNQDVTQRGLQAN